MYLEFWRSTNYFTQDVILLQLCLTTGYIFSKRENIQKNNVPIYYYLIGSLMIELTSKAVFKFNPDSVYFNYTNFLFLFFENTLLYWFILNHLKDKSRPVKSWAFINYMVLIIFLIYELMQQDPNSKNVSLLTAILNILILLFIFYQFSISKRGKNLFKNQALIIIISFVLAYSILTIYFLTINHLIGYSRILANQFIIFKNIINIIFYLLIGYAFSDKNIC